MLGEARGGTGLRRGLGLCGKSSWGSSGGGGVPQGPPTSLTLQKGRGSSTVALV